MTERQCLILLLEAEERIGDVAEYMRDCCWDTAAARLKRLIKACSLARRELEKLMRAD